MPRIGLTGTALALLAHGAFGGVCGALPTDELLDQLQERAFLYFWNEANPANGIVKDRTASWSPGKMAATGFGFSAICIGIDHGWVSREAGRERILTALETLWNGPQGPEPDGNIGYQGFFYHFVDLETAVRTWDCDLSPIDTALLFAGMIDAREYFATDDSLDVELRALADSIVHRADWTFMYNGLGIWLAWLPETGFDGMPTWLGYNEAMIMYLLAIGSPTHPIPPHSWFTWTAGYRWETHYGHTFVTFPPLFGHQYSHCWIDFRSIQDAYTRSRGITYFENSRRATMAQRAYCTANPLGHVGYGPDTWGLTASDDPFVGYLAHGAPPAQDDNGTLTPTAVASSLPFAPEVVIPALHHLYDTYGAQLWSTYGFKDAFHPGLGWIASDYIGIDQGPIVVMIENWRTGSVWQRVMQNADIQRGLELAGFEAAVGVDRRAVAPAGIALLPNFPNPFRRTSTVAYQLAKAGRVRLTLHDVGGREVRPLVDAFLPAGRHEARLDASGLRSGVYYYRLESSGQRLARRCVLIR